MPFFSCVELFYKDCSYLYILLVILYHLDSVVTLWLTLVSYFVSAYLYYQKFLLHLSP